MKINLIIVATFIYANTIGQLTINQIDKKLDSLQSAKLNTEQRIQAYNEQLNQINKEISELQKKKRILLDEITQNVIFARTGEGGAILRDKPSSLGNALQTIPPNTPIKVYKEHENLYLKVEYNNQMGYVSYSTIASNQEIDDFLNGNPSKTIEKKQQSQTTIIRKVDENDPRYQKLQKLYGKETAIRIINQEIWEGMSIGQTIESIGKPQNKTNITTEEGVKEVWEYTNYTLEFFNGSLSKIIKK
jgi:hypothetical protein